MAWTSTNLSKLIEKIESGGRPKGGVSEDSGEIPSLGGENIRQSGGLDLDSVRRVPISYYKQMSKGVLQNTDVLINKDGANTGKVGFYEGQYQEATINEHLFLLRGFSQEIDQKFLYYKLLSQEGQAIIRSKISGSAQPGLKSDFTTNFPVRIPESITEQQAITCVIDSVDHAIKDTESLIAKYQRIKTGLMHDLLTRGIDENGQLRHPSTHKFKSSPLGMIPEEWEVIKLMEIAEVDRGKFTHRPRNDPAYYGGEFPFIQTGDITSNIGRYLRTYSQTLSVKGVQVSKEFPAGTIAVTIAANIADTAILDIPMYFPDLVVGVTVHDDYSKRYVELSIRSRKPWFEKLAPQSAQKNINLNDLRPLIIPLPKPKERILICNVYEKMLTTIISLEKKASNLRRIKIGLLQDLLTGKVSIESTMNIFIGESDAE